MADQKKSAWKGLRVGLLGLALAAGAGAVTAVGQALSDTQVVSNLLSAIPPEYAPLAGVVIAAVAEYLRNLYTHP